jgi:hypothetical protein
MRLRLDPNARDRGLRRPRLGTDRPPHDEAEVDNRDLEDDEHPDQLPGHRFILGNRRPATSLRRLACPSNALIGPWLPADELCMTRLLGLMSVVAALAAAAYLYAAQTRDAGPASPAVTSAEARAETTAAVASFQGVVASLQAWFAENGTYAGAVLPPGSGVVLARADSNGYCLQTTAGTAVEHELGPGGQPQPGPC